MSRFSLCFFFPIFALVGCGAGTTTSSTADVEADVAATDVEMTDAVDSTDATSGTDVVADIAGTDASPEVDSQPGTDAIADTIDAVAPDVTVDVADTADAVDAADTVNINKAVLDAYNLKSGVPAPAAQPAGAAPRPAATAPKPAAPAAKPAAKPATTR